MSDGSIHAAGWRPTPASTQQHAKRKEVEIDGKRVQAPPEPSSGPPVRTRSAIAVAKPSRSEVETFLLEGIGILARTRAEQAALAASARTLVESRGAGVSGAPSQRQAVAELIKAIARPTAPACDAGKLLRAVVEAVRATGNTSLLAHMVHALVSHLREPGREPALMNLVAIGCALSCTLGTPRTRHPLMLAALRALGPEEGSTGGLSEEGYSGLLAGVQMASEPISGLMPRRLPSGMHGRAAATVIAVAAPMEDLLSEARIAYLEKTRLTPHEVLEVLQAALRHGIHGFTPQTFRRVRELLLRIADSDARSSAGERKGHGARQPLDADLLASAMLLLYEQLGRAFALDRFSGTSQPLRGCVDMLHREWIAIDAAKALPGPVREVLRNLLKRHRDTLEQALAVAGSS